MIARLFILVSSCWGQPQTPGKCGAFARLVSPGVGALVNLAEAEGRVLALLEHSLFFQREDLKEGDVCFWEMKITIKLREKVLIHGVEVECKIQTIQDEIYCSHRSFLSAENIEILVF